MRAAVSDVERVAEAASGRDARRGSLAGIVAAALLALGGAAQAEPLDFTGSLSLSIAGFGVGIPGAGTAQVGGFGAYGSFELPGGAFAADALTVTVTGAEPVGGLQVTAQNGAGAFAAPVGGAMPIAGFAKVCVFGPCAGPLANVVVPLSVIGAGGTATAEGAVNVTVVGAPWTTGTAIVGTETAMGYARGAASGASTVAPSGEIQLVTPVRIYTNLSNDFATIAGFGVLTLHFVPEPSTLALVAGGLALTTALGRRRARSVAERASND